MQIDPMDDGYQALFEEYDDSGWCWAVPFSELPGNVLRVDHGKLLPHPCNAGCKILMETSVELTFVAGEIFTGLEHTSYTPRTPECDARACGFPCEERAFHPIWGPAPSRRCGFACEVTYAWTGTRAGSTFAATGCTLEAGEAPKGPGPA